MWSGWTAHIDVTTFLGASLLGSRSSLLILVERPFLFLFKFLLGRFGFNSLTYFYLWKSWCFLVTAQDAEHHPQNFIFSHVLMDILASWVRIPWEVDSPKVSQDPREGGQAKGIDLRRGSLWCLGGLLPGRMFLLMPQKCGAHIPGLLKILSWSIPHV